MPETVADVLVRLGVDTEGLRTGFRDARSQTASFATDLAQLLSFGGGTGSILQGLTRAGGSLIPGPFGAVLRGISGLFSPIGGLFTRAARRAAREIKQNLQEILAAYRA